MGNNERPQKIRVSFSRAYRLKYVGCGVLDRCFTHPMLPWVVGEIKRKGIKDADTILLEVTSSSLRAISCSRTGSISGYEELLFEHGFPSICKVAHYPHDKASFAYLTRDQVEAPFTCHVFQATDEPTVLELFATMRDMGKNATGTTFTGPNMCKNGTTVGIPLVARMGGSVDSYSSNSQQFEVLYIGKIKVSHKRAPPSFIDEAVEKFKQYEQERSQQQQQSLPLSNPPSGHPSPTAPNAPISIPPTNVICTQTLKPLENKGRHRHGSGSSVSSLPYALEETVIVKENELGKSEEVLSRPQRRRGKKMRSHGDLPSSLEDPRMEEEEDGSQSDDVSHGSTGSIEFGVRALKDVGEEVSVKVEPIISPVVSVTSSVVDTLGIHSLVTQTQSMDASARSSVLQDLKQCAALESPSNLQETETASSGSTLCVPSPSMDGSFVTHSQSLDIPGRSSILQDLQQASQTPQLADRLANQRVRSVSGDMPRATKQTSLPFYRSRVSSGGHMELKRKEASSSDGGHLNRAMLFLIGKLDLCLIGTDMKQVLLRKTFSDISHCCKGVKRADHFGFICREVSLTQVDAYVGYVFRCQTKLVVDEIMQSLKQAFNSAHQAYQKQQQQVKGQQSLCESCPMHWFHRLCVDLEGLPADKVQLMILRRMKTLTDPEREDIMIKYQGAESDKVQEQNEIFMMLLRALCEHKQLRHTHQHHANQSQYFPSSQNNHIFLFGKTESLPAGDRKVGAFDNLKEKARKSLSNSFDSILKKRSKEDLREKKEHGTLSRGDSLESTDGSEQSPPHRLAAEKLANEVKNSNTLSCDPAKTRIRESSWDPQRDGRQSPTGDDSSLPPRPRSSTFSTPGEVQKVKSKTGGGLFPEGKSPIMNIFMKVGNQNKGVLPPSSLSKGDLDGGGAPSRSLPATPDSLKKGPWRQTIFQKVQSPNTTLLDANRSSGGKETEIAPLPVIRRSTQELRRLWKKAIMEQILLIRMENENKKLKVNQDAVSHKRMRLDYQEVTPCLKDATQTWERLLSQSETESPPETTDTTIQAPSFCIVEKSVLTLAVKEGVPRHRRGDIWKFLANHQRSEQEIAQQWDYFGPDSPDPVETQDVHYGQLLKQLTPHQHAILIDLGRTFPSHPFFAQPLGAGQLSLFNLLKAYSLLDPLVGYCQGLSFVAGVLLLHMGEEESFHLMRHVLFHLGFRKQYKPDMVALQIQMYQLSRLIHDTHRDVYEHFEEHDIAPTLYAAPWFLTLFASQFPLGFVARLFDLIFLQGIDVVFKVALVLLGQHKEVLLSCHGFEPVMDFLKNSLPNMGIIQMERLFSAVFSLDISRQLQAYRVEYQVLQEELLAYGSLERRASPPYSPAKRASIDLERLKVSEDQHQQQLSLLRQQLQQQTDSAKQLNALNKELKRQNTELQDQCESVHGRAFALESQVSSYQSTVRRLETRARDLEDERDALLHSVNVMRKRLEAYETSGGPRRSLTSLGPQESLEGRIEEVSPPPPEDVEERAPSLGLIAKDTREELSKAVRKLSEQMSQQASMQAQQEAKEMHHPLMDI